MADGEESAVARPLRARERNPLEADRGDERSHDPQRVGSRPGGRCEQRGVDRDQRGAGEADPATHSERAQPSGHEHAQRQPAEHRRQAQRRLAEAQQPGADPQDVEEERAQVGHPAARRDFGEPIGDDPARNHLVEPESGAQAVDAQERRDEQDGEQREQVARASARRLIEGLATRLGHLRTPLRLRRPVARARTGGRRIAGDRLRHPPRARVAQQRCGEPAPAAGREPPP